MLLLALAIPAQAQTTTQHRNIAALSELSESLRDLSTRVSPSVVQVIGTGYGFETDEQHTGASILSRQRSTGSGIILSEDGYIMTNAHVIDGARSIRVKLNGRRSGSSLVDARLIGADGMLDLALLKVDIADLQPLELGNTADVQQGELVLAFGSPLGMDNSVSMGIVSAVARQLGDDDPRIYIQTDAPINPGSSGGPLVDVQGRMVGMNTFIFTQSGGSEGIGFAIPSNVVRYVYASLKKDGHVHRGQIGLFVRTITGPLAAAFDLEPEHGVLVEDVNPDGPAAKAGIEIGDVVLAVGGTALHNVRDLALQLYLYTIGDTVDLEIVHEGEQATVHVPVSEKSDDPERFTDMVTLDKNLVAKLAILGLTIDDKIRESLTLRYDDGVLVAALAGPIPYFGDEPQQGDVIYAVNGRRVASVEALRDALEGVKAAQPIVLQVERNNGLKFLVLEND